MVKCKGDDVLEKGLIKGLVVRDIHVYGDMGRDNYTETGGQEDYLCYFLLDRVDRLNVLYTSGSFLKIRICSAP